MGKSKSKNGDFTFKPQISNTSRRIALAARDDSKDVPHFMLDTVTQHMKNSLVEKYPIHYIGHHRTEEGMAASIKPPAKYNSDQHSKLGSDKLRKKGGKAGHIGNSKAASVAARLIEETTFTFKPKVSPQSVKIADNLDTDFMARQQQHIERQKRYFEQASSQFKNPSLLNGKLSPVQRSKKMKDIKTSVLDEPCVTKARCSTTIPTQKSPNTTQHTLSDVMALSSSSLSSSKLHLEKSSILQDSDLDGDGVPLHLCRSKNKAMATSPTVASFVNKKVTSVNLDRLKNAKVIAERAMKQKRVFTIQGPYPAIRNSLRRRGWVEKFYKVQAASHHGKKTTVKKKRRVAETDSPDDTDDDDDDDDAYDDCDDDCDDPNDHGGKVPPWEEDNGIYGIMSRVVRNASPTFIWSVRRDVVDPKALRREQMINHYGKAGSFTTKVGLCVNMRNLPWFEQADPAAFFPRCYRLSHEEEKHTFIDDFRLTACMNILKKVEDNASSPLAEDNIEETAKTAYTDETSPSCTPPECSMSRPDTCISNKGIQDVVLDLPKKANPKQKKVEEIPLDAVDLALSHCETFLRSLNHEDLDDCQKDHAFSEIQWDQFIKWHYDIVHDDAIVKESNSRRHEILQCLSKLEEKWPQFKLDGCKNVWIVKPGAKSRGRGITCYDRLDDMLRLVKSCVRKDSKYVVQKYMERPLLIYRTKFDIRQWFLVTDWNPLTVWSYKDSYLRFCSQEYTLDNFDEAIHLSNNAIQHKYSASAGRSSKLPSSNMWTSDDFRNYLRERGQEAVWDETIYPGMKKACICAILCSQDIVEYRKNGFELYGADFMLTDNFHPWLIEINCSPSMSSSTPVTAKLCNSVLEDTVKVVLDRKLDKSADIGRFELAYKQPQVSVPPYIGIDLSLSGQGVPRPSWMSPKKIEDVPVKMISNATRGLHQVRESLYQPKGTSRREKSPLRQNGEKVPAGVSKTYHSSWGNSKHYVPKPTQSWTKAVRRKAMKNLDTIPGKEDGSNSDSSEDFAQRYQNTTNKGNYLHSFLDKTPMSLNRSIQEIPNGKSVLVAIKRIRPKTAQSSHANVKRGEVGASSIATNEVGTNCKEILKHVPSSAPSVLSRSATPCHGTENTLESDKSMSDAARALMENPCHSGRTQSVDTRNASPGHLRLNQQGQMLNMADKCMLPLQKAEPVDITTMQTDMNRETFNLPSLAGPVVSSEYVTNHLPSTIAPASVLAARGRPSQVKHSQRTRKKPHMPLDGHFGIESLPPPDLLTSRIPAVPYCNVNVMYRFGRQNVPRLKYIKTSNNAIDRIHKMNDELDKIHKQVTTTGSPQL